MTTPALTQALSGHLCEEEVLNLLGISRATLDERRRNGKEHPPYVEIGRVRFYSIDQFQEWLRHLPTQHQVTYLRRRHVG